MSFFKKYYSLILIFIAGNVIAELDLENRFTIDTLIFDSSTNKVNISWSIDSSDAGDSITFYGAFNIGYIEANISGEVGGVNQPADSEFKDLVTGLTNPFQVDLGHSLLFDSTLYVGMWMKAISSGNDSVIKSSSIFAGQDSKKSILIPSFKWQSVYIPGTVIDSAFPIANGSIYFKQTIGTELTLNRVQLSEESIDSSFITLDVPAINFINKAQIPIEIGFKIPDLSTSNILEEQIGLYTIDGSNYKFNHNYEKEDSILWLSFSVGDFGTTFYDSTITLAMLADTVLPVIDTAISPISLTTSDTAITTTFKTTDNISNAKWEIYYARGDQIFSIKDSGFCDNTNDSITFSKKDDLNQVLFAETGTRILLVVSDGVNRTIKDLSLSVSGNIQYSLNMNAGKWVPIYTKSKLNEDSLYTILNNSTKVFPEGWSYDKTEQRFFRYLTTSGTDTTTGWLEYSDTTAKHFNLEPGNIIWCKSREGKFGIPYGSGSSNSLTTPYSLKIPIGKFTDFVLPYYFNVYLTDILKVNDTSVTNYIDIYSWEEDTSTGQISAVPVYMSDSIKTIDKLISSTNALNSSYTLFNGSLIDSINIPGIADTVSQFLKDMQDSLVQRKRYVQKRATNEKNKNVAYIKWQANKSGEWGKLLISTSRDHRDTKYSPLPMTFGNVSAAIINENDDMFAAYASLPINNNGLSQTVIKITNNDKEDKSVELSTELVKTTSNDFDIYFISNNRLYENGNAEIVVPAGESRDVKVISGSRYDLNSSNLIINNYNFAILNSFPNPFKAMVNLKYRLPTDIKTVNIEMFNSKGRKLYSFDESSNVAAGNYTHIINTDNILGNKIASGAYFLKVTATKIDGKKLSMEKKTICIK